MAEDKAKYCERMLKSLRAIREPCESMVDEVIKYVNHSRRQITDKDSTKGMKTGMDVYDGTPLSAANLLSDGICGYSVARNLRWFALSIPHKFNFPRTSTMRRWGGKRTDEYPDVREWLDDSADVLYSAFDRSNFYEGVTEFIRDGATVGTVTLLSEEDLAADRIVFTVPHFRETYISENAFGFVDTNYRVYKLTLQQLADKFGKEALRRVWIDFDIRYDRDPFVEEEILHAVYPRKYVVEGRMDAEGKPIESVWVIMKPLTLIKEEGYWENSSITWRWRKNNDEWYGRSPAWDAYVEIMTGQQQGRSNLIAGQKMVEPAMMGPSDLRGKVNSGPKGWTWIEPMNYNKGTYPQPLVTGIQLPYAVQAQDRTDAKIREHFHVDFFLMLWQAAFNKVELTATQVIEMAGEKAAILGTRLGRLESEAFNPIIDRVFAIEFRAGRIPYPPPILSELVGNKIEVDYQGPLAQAQKRLFVSQGIRAGLERMMQLGELFPQALDRVDPDVVAKMILDSSGFPSSAIRGDPAVNKIRNDREKKAAMERTAGMVPGMAKASKDAAVAPEPGSPLEGMMGAGE